MSKIILCRGIQGSGKTTWAKQYCKEHPNSIRVNRDDIRAMMGCKWSQSLEVVVRSSELRAIEVAISLGIDVVVDDVSNLNQGTETAIYNIVNEFNRAGSSFNKTFEECTIEYRDFFIPLEVCIERDSKRENPIGEEVIRKTYERYKSIIEGV